MEEKKNVNQAPELTDEALNAVAGGIGNLTDVVTCTCCREGKIAIPPSGPWAELCPHCHATITCFDGKIQFCIPQTHQPTDLCDTDDSWL